MENATPHSNDQEKKLLAPLTPKERIVILDILRGFAILGIFIANLGFLTGFNFQPSETKEAITTGAGHVGLFLMKLLVDGKFYSIFSFLFGIGFAVQMMRAEAKGGPFLPLYLKRIFFLFLFGVIHIMIWPGDILTVYAITALFLIPFKWLSNKIVIIVAIILLLSPILFYSLMLATGFVIGGFLFDAAGSFGAYLKAMGPAQSIQSGGMKDVVLSNLTGVMYRYGDLFFSSRWPKVLGMFLLGFWFGRKEIFSNVQMHLALFRRVLIGCGIAGFMACLAMALLEEQHSTLPLSINGLYITIAYAAGVHTLALAYIAGLTLLYHHNKAATFLAWLAPAGRMALTNYLAQSLIGVFVFYNIGLGYGPVGPVTWIPFGVTVFALQVLFSHWWLSKFRFGPVEWLWRSLTYGKWQPMGRPVSPSPLNPSA